MTLLDADARHQAIDPKHSFAVAAPAGSGKTELLIQRTLSLLAGVEQPENILAITFTRKAANEMRERVVEALEMAKSGAPIKSDHQRKTRQLAIAALQRDSEQNWQLLENTSRLRFQTIDSLCRQLAHQLCLETGIVVPPTLSDDSSLLYRQAAEKVIDFIDEPGATGEALRQLIAHLDGNLDSLCNLLAELLASRDSWLPIVLSGHVDQAYLQDRVHALIEETLGTVAEALIAYCSDLEALLDYALKHRQGADYLSPDLINTLPDCRAEHLHHWKALRSFLITAPGTHAKYRAGSRLNKRMGFPTESQHTDKATAKAQKQAYTELINALQQQPELFQQLNRLAILPDNFGVGCAEEDSNNLINQALFRLLPIAAAQFDILSQDIGETDFTSVAIAALNALGQPDQPTPLALRLDYRIQHILVDEFQDTSRVQIDLLERLTAGWQPDDGRSLFIVGDGMQSIYGFRKANVSLFIRARHEGIGDIQLIPLELTANFRSDRQIVDWINHSFARIFPAEDNLAQGQVAFNPAEPVEAKSDWSVDLTGYANDELEAEAIAADIDAKLAKGATNMAILVRSRKHLEPILPALRARGILWQAQDIDPLANRMAVMDLHSLTRALCIPADRIAWLAILRAPWAGLSMADLLHLCEWQPANQTSFPPIWLAVQAAQQNDLISPEGKIIIQRLYQSFTEAFNHFSKRPLRVVIEALWQRLDGPKGLLEPRDHRDADDYLDLLEKVEVGGLITDWQAFNRSLTKLYAQPDNAHSDNAHLHIMTMHKAKGLEFDHVYLPALGKTTGINSDPLLLWWQREYQDGSEGYLLAAKPIVDEDTSSVSLYRYLKAEDAERERQEIARLLYVACTRAKQSLFLTAVVSWDNDKQLVKNPARKSLLDVLWNTYQEAFTGNFAPSNQEEQERTEALTGLRRLPTDRPLSVIAEPTDNSDRVDELHHSHSFSQNYLARQAGELIHHSLMRIVRERMSAPAAADFMPQWQLGAAALGLDVPQTNKMLQNLEAMLTTTLADNTGRWILDFTHQDSVAELAIDYLDSLGSIKQAIIDRSFVDQGCRWIIDYKSSAPQQAESLDAFLSAEANRYRPQLQNYATLFDQPTRTMLYFPAIAASIEILPL